MSFLRVWPLLCFTFFCLACAASATSAQLERAEEFVYSEEQPVLWRPSVGNDEEDDRRSQLRVDSSGNVEDIKYHEDMADVPGLGRVVPVDAAEYGPDEAGEEVPWAESFAAPSRAYARQNGGLSAAGSRGNDRWNFEWVVKKLAAAFTPPAASDATPSGSSYALESAGAAADRVPSSRARLGTRKLRGGGR